ncbi:MAG: 30S ribosomal protein S20, partial [Bacteroidota bacterium]
MANHKATRKDVRQSATRRDRNRYYGKTTRNAIRSLQEVKDSKEAGNELVKV